MKNMLQFSSCQPINLKVRDKMTFKQGHGYLNRVFRPCSRLVIFGHIKNIINPVLMHSNIVYGHQLLCYVHNVPEQHWYLIIHFLRSFYLFQYRSNSQARWLFHKEQGDLLNSTHGTLPINRSQTSMSQQSVSVVKVKGLCCECATQQKLMQQCISLKPQCLLGDSTLQFV